MSDILAPNSYHCPLHSPPHSPNLLLHHPPSSTPVVLSPGSSCNLYTTEALSKRPRESALNGAEGTVPPGRIYKKVAIVENFFDIIHAVHVDLEGRPGKHAGQKRTYRTITETYAFLPREAVTRFLLGCTECQRRPRTPSPTNLSNQSSHPVVISSSITSTSSSTTTTTSSTSTRLSPTTSLAVTSNSTSQNNNNANTVGSNKSKDNTESKNSYNYRHHKQHHLKNNVVVVPANNTTDIKNDKDKEEKYNPLSITNLLKKEPNNSNGGFLSSTETLPESRRTPESDRASSRSSASSKRKRMLPEGRTPSPQPSQPLPRPWSPGLDPKNTPIDYSLPITTSYLKHQQRMAEKNKALKEAEEEQQQQLQQKQQQQQKIIAMEIDADNVERERFSPAAGLIDTNLNLLATIQDLHFQVMVALNERLRPSISMPTPLVLPSAHIISGGPIITGSEVSVQTGEHHL
ncbi:hypothetical protein M0802_010498 [Mischocyttarus mexicanus]|nr:hypothetical protein M0802_010498 [Mischocyttarus mexicanus]